MSPMNIEQQPLPSSQPLAEAMIHHYSKVEHFYEYDLTRREEWARRIDWLKQSDGRRLDRIKLTQVLKDFNREHNPHEAVMASIDLLEQGGTAVIVGGQQSGLLTGPLFVIYKALSIIKAAKEAQEKLSHPVVPVFWIAGEDHDWDEVDHTYLLSADQQIKRIRIAKRSEQRTPVSQVKVMQEDWGQIADELDNLLQNTEFKSGLLDAYRTLASQSGTLTECFAKLIGTLFGRFGLIVMDSADPHLRMLEVPVFERMIKQNDELEQAYLSAGKELAAGGFSLQADVHEGGANLFYVHEGERKLLFKQKGVFTDRKGTCSFSADELLAELHAHPERFSNNVLTRPLMQDSVLPVLGTVLGAGEIAYWALTGKAFQAFGIQMPVLVPRESFTMIDGAVQRNMEKYGLEWNDVNNKDSLSDKREAWLKEQDHLHLEERFAEIKSSFEAMYNPLIEQLGTVQAGLIKLGGANRDKIIEQIEYLRNKSMDALAKSNDSGIRHFERIEQSVIPMGRLQERTYNAFYYLNRYGWSWIDELAGIPYDVTGTHRILYL